MEVIELLDNLAADIEKQRQFLGLAFGFNKEELIVLIKRIKNALPEEVKKAGKITQEADQIKSVAQHEAETLLSRTKAECSKKLEAVMREVEQIREQANQERQRLTNEHEILKAAKHEAERVKHEADAEAARTKRSADDYALEVLTKLENNLARAISAIERGKADLQRPTRPIGTGTNR